MKIPFGKPILSDRDFKDVVKVLKSGVLVHGKKTSNSRIYLDLILIQSTQ